MARLGRQFAALVLAAVTLLAVAGPAAAANGTVSVFGCAATYVGNDTWAGNATVPAGTDLRLIQGWAAATRKQINQFLNRTTIKASINGVVIAHTADYWSTPYYSATIGMWETTWAYSRSALGSGQKIVVKTRLIFNQPVWDGTDTYRGHGPLLKCTIKAS